MDSQVGRVLDALKESGLEDNTIIVCWSDHGYHLGEKEITGKNTLWDPTTRVPLMFAGPGISKGARCGRPAELLDIYPTLAELCGLKSVPEEIEGLSLVPQLKDAKAPRSRPAMTSHGPGNDSVRTETHRYIRYADGSEELYDMRKDPHEDLFSYRRVLPIHPHSGYNDEFRCVRNRCRDHVRSWQDGNGEPWHPSVGEQG